MNQVSFPEDPHYGAAICWSPNFKSPVACDHEVMRRSCNNATIDADILRMGESMPRKSQTTPMMQQYQAIKDQYPDAFLFYALGIFLNYITMMPSKARGFLS
ncbi:hypothetical protein [Lacticaseibacillus manihotivorans]|uniref:hypothetical protein n=1 Tax=Lacticaseibacillus manihotivorans TaxID=88233 RepID=UPI000AC54FE1|nr:hypothetical protein [Lacticaseibacillus manihotivorans]